MALLIFYFLTFSLWPLTDHRYSIWREDQGRRKAARQLRTGALQQPKAFYLFK